MTNPQKTPLSRRDALRIITAAGTVFLMSAPDKWAKPIVRLGALPAHAQTSVRLSLSCPPNPAIVDLSGVSSFSPIATVQVSTALANVSMNYSVTQTNGLLFSSATGTVLTDASGVATVSPIDFQPVGETGTVVVAWQFTNAAVGTGSCQIVYAWFQDTF